MRFMQTFVSGSVRYVPSLVQYPGSSRPNRFTSSVGWRTCRSRNGKTWEKPWTTSEESGRVISSWHGSNAHLSESLSLHCDTSLEGVLGHQRNVFRNIVQCHRKILTALLQFEAFAWVGEVDAQPEDGIFELFGCLSLVNLHLVKRQNGFKLWRRSDCLTISGSESIASFLMTFSIRLSRERPSW